MSSIREDRALWFVGPRRVELRRDVVRPPETGEVAIRALASGVSQGTELLLYRGEGPDPFDPSLDSHDGHDGHDGRPAKPATYPRRYGYAWVGEVMATGTDTTMALGTRVFALAPHGDTHVLSATRVRALPHSIPAQRAVLAANLETAVTCAWDAEVGFGDKAIVLGGGVVGILTAWLLRRSGAQVTLLERSPMRRNAAAALLGTTGCIAPEAPPDGTADVIIEATGDPATLDSAIAWSRPEGSIVVASFYGSRRATVDLGSAFHRKRLHLRASQVSSVPPRRAGRWSQDRRFDLVLELLEEPNLDALLTPVAFATAPALYASLDVETDTPPGHVFVYR